MIRRFVCRFLLLPCSFLMISYSSNAQFFQECNFQFDTAYWLSCAHVDGVLIGCNVQTTQEVSGLDCQVFGFQDPNATGGGGLPDGDDGAAGVTLPGNTDEDNDGVTDCISDLTFMATPHVSSSFGPRTHPVTGLINNHNGTDLAIPTGTGLRSAQNGVVAQIDDQFTVGTGTGNGNFVRINYADGTQGVFSHMADVYVAAGDNVSIGQAIGTSNNTGTSSGPHLHYTIWNEHNHSGSANDLTNFSNPEDVHNDCPNDGVGS